jgi:hypothetical protein
MRFRIAQAVFLTLAVPLGLWHCYFAASALFVFRQNEPIASWIAVLVGPTLTLPLVVMSLWNRRAAGLGFVVASIVSGLATAMAGGIQEPAGLLFGLATLTSGPMLITGLACLAIESMRPLAPGGSGERG